MNRLVLQTCLVVENVSFVEVSSVLNMLACVSLCISGSVGITV